MQRLKIIKTTTAKNEIEKTENAINEMILNGATIESINPITTVSHKGITGSYITEVEILVFILYKE